MDKGLGMKGRRTKLKEKGFAQTSDTLACPEDQWSWEDGWEEAAGAWKGSTTLGSQITWS